MAIEFIAWALEQNIPTGPKFVLVALANRANESGQCWPSQTDIASQTGMASRSVRAHLEWLASKGLVRKSQRRRANGSFTSDQYFIQRQISPAANLASGKSRRPLRGKPKTSIEQNQAHPDQRQISPAAKVSAPEPSDRKKDETSNNSGRPADVCEQVWEDFKKHRKAKKAPITDTALAGIRQEAEKAGWVFEDALREVCSRGWTGFKADWVKEENGKRNGKKYTADDALGEVLNEIRANSPPGTPVLCDTGHLRQIPGGTQIPDAGND